MANWVREWPLRDDVWTDRDFEQRDERLEAREDTGWYEEWNPLLAEGDERCADGFVVGASRVRQTDLSQYLAPSASSEDTAFNEEWAGPGVEGPTGEATAGSSPAASSDPALAALVSLFEKDAA